MDIRNRNSIQAVKLNPPQEQAKPLKRERSRLLGRSTSRDGLSVLFSAICIVDVFGVFPLITLPKTIIDCGFYGIFVIVLVCSVQMYTAILLGKCWKMAEQICPNINRGNRYPYSALAELAFGKHSSRYVTVLVDLTVFSGGIPNLIVASQNLQLLGQRLTEGTFDVSFCYWILVLGTLLCPVLWIGSPKDMKVLCTVSVLIVSTVFLLICGCLLLTPGASNPETPASFETNLPLWQTLLLAYGIVAFQFDVHPTVLTIQMDMYDKSKLHLAVTWAFLASLSMFGVIAAITVAKFGTTTQPSILETLTSSAPLHLAAGLVALQLCLTSAVSNSALYQHMEDCLNISPEFNYKRCVLRTILTIFAIVIAESVPRFDLVMSLIGGTLTGPLVFILPPVFYIKILHLHKNHEDALVSASFTNVVLSEESEEETSLNLAKYYEHKFREEFKSTFDISDIKCIDKNFEIIVCVIVILGSFIATLITTFLNFKNAAASYSNFTRPCIYNISNALLYL
ncbi:uncharacterized protein LOC132696319 [Cylas formicarius]|uniref:uncharacterized protein LOC132696319 n=1 Tax=Cylas formicarius TaxID=197179 RepID=UPI00295873EF|nr:uncharacterized protein LOC132696319 [Cylas formicarius]